MRKAILEARCLPFGLFCACEKEDYSDAYARLSPHLSSLRYKYQNIMRWLILFLLFNDLGLFT